MTINQSMHIHEPLQTDVRVFKSARDTDEIDFIVFDLGPLSVYFREGGIETLRELADKIHAALNPAPEPKRCEFRNELGIQCLSVAERSQGTQYDFCDEHGVFFAA